MRVAALEDLVEEYKAREAQTRAHNKVNINRPLVQRILIDILCRHCVRRCVKSSPPPPFWSDSEIQELVIGPHAKSLAPRISTPQHHQTLRMYHQDPTLLDRQLHRALQVRKTSIWNI